MSPHLRAVSRLCALISCLIVVLSTGSVLAQGIEQDAHSGTVSLALGAVGQSFRATGTSLHHVTVHVDDYNPELGNYLLKMQIYAGEGFGGALLATQTEQMPTGYRGAWVVDFSGLLLSVGSPYSVRVSSVTGRGGVQRNQHTSMEGDVISWDYPGGHLLDQFGVPNLLADLRFSAWFDGCVSAVEQDRGEGAVSLAGGAIGQTFTPIHPVADALTLWFVDVNEQLGDFEVLVEVFEGAGFAGARIFSAQKTLPDGHTGPFQLNLQSLQMAPGLPYSLRVTSPSGRGAAQRHWHTTIQGQIVGVDYLGGDELDSAGAPNPLADLRFRLEGHVGPRVVQQPYANGVSSLAIGAWGQSFVAAGARLGQATVFLRDNGVGDFKVRLDVFEGVGFDGPPVVSRAQQLPAGFIGPWQLDLGVALVPGAFYSLRVSSPDGRAALDRNQHRTLDGLVLSPDVPGDLLDGNGAVNTFLDLRFALAFDQHCTLKATQAGMVAVCGETMIPLTPDCLVSQFDDGTVVVECPAVCLSAIDGCPGNVDLLPGTCGCGVSDVDGDDDGAPDCIDSCPVDQDKVDFGICGCGIVDYDSDGDSIADCVDYCFKDPNKVDFGVCGCGMEDTDSDGDGVADCVDYCSEDPNKVDFGVCGCDREDRDYDGDNDIDWVDCVLLEADLGRDSSKRVRREASAVLGKAVSEAVQAESTQVKSGWQFTTAQIQAVRTLRMRPFSELAVVAQGRSTSICGDGPKDSACASGKAARRYDIVGALKALALSADVPFDLVVDGEMPVWYWLVDDDGTQLLIDERSGTELQVFSED